ncbi:hypothetical protein MATL_G00151500 [Megalops atlanticus]|uniref:Ig-like domain-containing protein n=1 Tax=Megalops atlanticus TaxID=7932 RepID=A0A9D3T8U9_MEGAT|nr:hypothetical protein MATL_G00151500 [Megalops atlanticus]
MRVKCIPAPLSLLTVLSVYVAAAHRTPRLPMRGGCYHVSADVPEFTVQGEAVVLRCSFLERYLHRQGLSQAEGYTFSFHSGDLSSEGAPVLSDDRGRVREQGHRLWLLPALTRDSGNYSCVFRNASYCFAGTISLHVYETKHSHLDIISYPMSATPGQEGMIRCPQLTEFKNRGKLQWFKESTPIVFTANRTRYRRDTETSFIIRNVIPADEGYYTCQLQVFLNNTQYTVTRIIKLHVAALGPIDVLPTIRPSQSSVGRKALRPKILDPVNGTFFHSSFGSSLEILCRVLIWNQSADSTEVTWMVNGLPVEESFLGGRALLGEKKVTVMNGRNHIELRLTFLELHEEDSRAEIKCVAQNLGGREEVVAWVRLEDFMSTWLVVAAVGTICFLTMVCVFLYQLLKPRQNKDYILTRQNSTF